METKTFIGIYHSEPELIAKIDDLKRQGLEGDDIYVVAKNENDISMVRGRTDADIQTADGDSWMDRFMAFMSGEEPVRGALHDMGVSDEDAERYYTEIQNGGILLYVDREYGSRYTDDTAHTADELTSRGAEDENLRENAFTANEHDHNLREEEKLRLHEEKLNINKTRVQTGEVQVEKEVIEEQQVIDVPVQREEVIVERRPVTETALNQSNSHSAELDERDHAFTENDETIRVPITEERVEVTKKPVVTEEIVISKRTVEDTETVRDTVKHEEAHIDEKDKLTQKSQDRDLF